MLKLQQRLMRELQQNPHVKIVKSTKWSVPIRTIEVTYEPLRRATMDVLMKMLLISMQEAQFQNVQELSELLLVDTLFIEDIVSLMLRVHLIDQTEGLYKLTPKGEQQLRRGIFEEELEIETVTLLFSPCHQAMLPVEEEDIEVFDELPEPFRYVDKEAEQQERFDETMIIAALQQEEAEMGSQKIIETVVAVNAKQIYDIPCLEFLLYDKKQNIVYVRVWNTLLKQWDKKLEQLLTEKEQLQWHAQY